MWVVEGGGFDPPKASPTDLQSVPFRHSGTPPLKPISSKPPSLNALKYFVKYYFFLELAMGLEPATC